MPRYDTTQATLYEMKVLQVVCDCLTMVQDGSVLQVIHRVRSLVGERMWCSGPIIAL